MKLIIFLLTLFFYITLVKTQTKITPGEPIRSIQTGRGVYRLFYFLRSEIPNDIPDDDHILIMISPYSGEADLVVRNDRYPEVGGTCPPENCKKSTSPGGNIIELRLGDRWFNEQLYIGVYGETNCMFAITAWYTGTNSNLHPIQLNGETTQFARTMSNKYTYFSFYLDAQVNFTVSVSKVIGDPDVFISTQTNMPNQTHNEWMRQRFGSDYFPITVTDPNYRFNAFYHISVYGYEDTTVFTISVTKQDTYTPLLDGLPAENFVGDGAWKYYVYYHQERVEGNVDLQFTLQPTSFNGDPDLFIYHEGSGRTGLPSSRNYQWASRNFRGRTDHVYLRNALPGKYYIGVEGFSHSDFKLIGASEYAHITLRLGSSVEAPCRQDSWTYFRHHSGDDENSLTFTAVPRIGRVDIYSSQAPNRRPNDEEGRYEFKGVSSGNNKYIFIEKPKINDYYLGVKCYENSSIIVSATAPHVHTILREGIASPWNHVPEGYYRYFILDGVKKSNDVTFSLNSFYGDSDLYVSQINTDPSRLNYTWSSTRGRGRVDGITIYKNDPKFITTKFYIGVYGYTDSYFQILGFQTDSEILLNDGIALPGSVSGPNEDSKENYVIYKFVAPESSGWGQRYSVTFTVQVTSGFNTSIALFAARSDNHRPSSLNHEWSSYSSPHRINIVNSYERTYYLSVLGLRADVPGNRAKYLITARTTEQFLPPNGFAVHEVTKAGRMERFTTSFERGWYTNGITHGLISVSLISGKTRLYLSTNSSRPADIDSDFKSLTWPGNTILVTTKDPKFLYDKWSFAVYAERDSEYYVRVIARFAQLQEGIPTLCQSPIGNATYFHYFIRGHNGVVTDDHIINIRVRSGSVRIYGSQDEIPTPSRHNFTVAFSPSSNQLLLLSKERIRPGTLHLAVYGERTSGFITTVAEYDIVAQPHSEPRVLVHDQQQRHILLSPTDANYFRILNAPQLSKKIYIEVQICDEIRPPIFYLSTDNHRPSRLNNTLTSTFPNEYTSVISGEVPGRSEYFVGVYPRTEIGRTPYQIYITTDTDLRPKPRDYSLTEHSYYHGQLTINIPPVNNPSGNRLFYSLYITDVVLQDGLPPNVNMKSTCGVVKHGKHNITFPVLDSALGRRVEIRVDYRTIYLLNVIVHDDYGLASAYKPVWIVKGHMYDEFPGAHPILPFSVGSILLAIIIFAFCFYLVCGLIFKIAKGGKGINVIPNVEFWKDLPYLVADGFTFMITCGRKRNYVKMDEDKSVDTTSEKEIQKEVANDQSTNSSKGYGAI